MNWICSNETLTCIIFAWKGNELVLDVLSNNVLDNWTVIGYWDTRDVASCIGGLIGLMDVPIVFDSIFQLVVVRHKQDQ